MPIKVACTAANAGTPEAAFAPACSGGLRMTARAPGSHRRIKLGEAPFSVPAGATGKVRLSLGPTARRLVAENGRLRTRLVLVDSSGARSKRKLALVPGRR